MNRGQWIIGIVIWALLLVAGTNRHTAIVSEEGMVIGHKRYNTSFIFFSMLPLIIWAGFRRGYGYADTNAYISMYREISSSYERFQYYINYINTEDKGFSIYLYILKTIFRDNYRPFILITAVFHCLTIAFFFRRYSWDYPLSFCLFIISTEYFGWIFNGMRQFTAVCIALYAVPFYFEKKYIKSSLIILLASTFHASAIILLPIGIVVKGKPWNIKTILALLGGILALTATGLFTNVLEDITVNTQYSGAVQSWTVENDNGANPFRVAVYTVPALLAFFGRKKLEQLDDPLVDVSINMSIITAALWIIAMATSGIYMGRLPIYTLLFNYILLPIELAVVINHRQRALVTVCMITMYLLFYYYQFHTTFGAI